MGMDEHEIFNDVVGAPATADALRSIVARHQRTRTRALAVALAVALIAGPLAGWVVARSGDGAVTQGAARDRVRRLATATGAGHSPRARAGNGVLEQRVG